MKRSITLLLLICLSTQLFSQGIFDRHSKQEEESAKSISKLNNLYYYLDNLYIDSVNYNRLTDKIIDLIIKELDPHSMYISAEEVEAMNEPLDGNFDGIGVEFAIINDTLSIQSTIPDGPSEKVGIKAGDKIIKVDGVDISGDSLTIPRVHSYLRGPKGSKVNVSVVRKRVDQVLEFTINRDKIPLNSLEASYLIDSEILYLKLSRFAATSHEEIIKAYQNLKRKPSSIIFDLRGNSGGYLHIALQIVNEFLDEGEPILYTEGRSVERVDEYANGYGRFKDIPIAVIIDEESASASEIVSGAIQDLDRGTVIGRRSFGKGLVQQRLPLRDGSELRLTIARYHTPSGRVIQSPYEQGNKEEYYKQSFERYFNGEMFSKDSIQVPDSLKYKTLKLGRTVYGGGGIVPDIFIPRDTSYYSNFYREVAMKGIVNDFVYDYVDSNRDKIEKEYSSYEKFVKRFTVTQEFFDQFISYAKERGVEPKPEEIAISKSELDKNLKGLIIRGMYGFEPFIEYLNIYDTDVLKAIDILKR